MIDQLQEHLGRDRAVEDDVRPFPALGLPSHAFRDGDRRRPGAIFFLSAWPHRIISTGVGSSRKSWTNISRDPSRIPELVSVFRPDRDPGLLEAALPQQFDEIVHGGGPPVRIESGLTRGKRSLSSSGITGKAMQLAMPQMAHERLSFHRRPEKTPHSGGSGSGASRHWHAGRRLGYLRPNRHPDHPEEPSR